MDEKFKKIILGTVQLGLQYGVNNVTGKPTEEESLQILKKAISEGITTLDTADAYGDSQSLIGQFHRQYPDFRFEVLSKFKSTTLTSQRDLKSTLDKLSIEHFECISFHEFNDSKNKTLIESCLQLKEQGLAKSVGVSLYTNDEFREAISMPFVDIIQLPFNLFDNWSVRGELIKEAKEKGKKVHIRSIYLQGLFFKEPSTLSQSLSPFRECLIELRNFANNFGSSIEELSLLYAFEFEEIDRVLIGVESVGQLSANLAVLKRKNKFPFSELKFKNAPPVSLLDPRNWK